MVTRCMRLIVLVAFLFVGYIVFPTDYYVDQILGSNNNNGLYQVDQGGSSGPWKNIPGSIGVTGSGWNTIVAGDTIIVKGGQIQNYTISIDSSWYNNGSPANLIVIKSGHLVGWGSTRARVDGETTVRGKGFSINSRSYVRIEGFEISNMKNETNSAGIFISGSATYCEIVSNIIHHIWGAAGASGYGVEVTGTTTAAHHLIEKNEIYNVEEKAIELYRQGYNTVRCNFVHQTNDHGIVISSPSNLIYNNMVREAGFDWDGGAAAFRPSYGIKADSGSSVLADNNKIFNNIVWDCNSGIAILNGKNNEIIHNTVYYMGWGDLYSDGGRELIAIALVDDGTSSNPVEGNTIANNIFYYSNMFSNTKEATLYYANNIGDDNTVRNNLIYHSATKTGSLIRYYSGSYSYYSVDYFEGSSGFMAVGSGNNASGNVVEEPNLKGGIGSALLGSAPTGFDGNWIPNSDGFSPTSDSPEEVLYGGLTVGPPYDLDITGIPRTNFTMGAYEYSDTLAQNISPPTGLRLEN